jgi:hypothetical protein
MTIAEIIEAAESYEEDYEVVGIRTQEIPFELGAISHLSKVWYDGEETDDFLEGICCTSINSHSVKMHSSEHDSWSGYYYGDYAAIVCGNEYTMGEDDGEVVIMDAVVVKILK